MQMTFYVSSRVTLLFDWWDVHGATGMVLSVLVLFLFTILYELMKMWRVWLSNGSSQLTNQEPVCSISSSSVHMLDSSPSHSSLTPIITKPPSNSCLLHVSQTLLHVLQVSLGYLLMLCVMSYNVWIFVGVVFGSALGYFISFPLLDRGPIQTPVR
ncbi:protein SLC31A2 isoform X2 [Gouania willdenowi]|nr:probable low affinity copper uptake protein 2 isoform X2 [Gouania willdenowi]